MIRLYSLPHIRTHKLSASYVDGQRGNSKAFQELRRQSYLEDVAFDATDRTEKAEAEKELAAITKKGNTNE
jgi:hypothetical protein